VIIGNAAMALGPDSSLYLAATGTPSLGSPGPIAMSVTHLTADAARVRYSSSFTTYFVVGGVVVDASGNAMWLPTSPAMESLSLPVTSLS
jgi:hypothetical protein